MCLNGCSLYIISDATSANATNIDVVSKHVITHSKCVRFGDTYIKIGTIQRRLAWPLRKDDTQIREAFQIFNLSVTRLLDVCCPVL